MRIAPLFVIPLLWNCSGFNSQSISQKNQSDTLSVNYTYWYPGGPFTGLCGDSYTLVFTGTITKLDPPSAAETNYTPQKGTIKINEIKFKKSPTETIESNKENFERTYKNQSYFRSDCFFNTGLKEGDKVLVFVYSYEGDYSIPGSSILKIDSFNDPAVSSIEKYIRSGQNPLVIEGDTIIWHKYGFDHNLKQIIDCKRNLEKK